MERVRVDIHNPLCSLQVRRPRISPGKLATAIIAMAGLAYFNTAFADEDNAAIDQTGTQNSAQIDQQNGESNLYAAIAQHGRINDATIRQVGPVKQSIASEIQQMGTANSAFTDQNDVEFLATLSVQQDGYGNTAVAKQTAAITASGFIEQSGALNSANLDQTQTNTVAVIDQSGTANYARVAQSGVSPYDQTAEVHQDGSGNNIAVLQDVMGMNELHSLQLGTDNHAEVHQWQSPDISYGVSRVDLSTNGNRNQVYVEQANNPIGDFVLQQSGNSNLVTVYQGGENADTYIKSQHSDHNTDTIHQLGLSARIEISRYYTNNSSTEISQASFDDTVFVEQGHADSATAIVDQWSTLGTAAKVRQVRVQDVLATVDQTSYSSKATIEQTDGVQSSTAYIRQDHLDTDLAVDLIASIYQSEGTDISSAEIEQYNNGNVALIQQLGVTDNSASIWQGGISGYAEIVQTGLDGGISNSATIVQSGEGYSASIHQDGNYNEATISQM